MSGTDQGKELAVLGKRIARRGFLKAAVMATGGVAGGFLLAACGGGTATPAATETATTAATETATAASTTETATAAVTETATATAAASGDVSAETWPWPQATAGQKGGQVIYGTSQESVNFNPLLYVNSGTETVPEHLMFDPLWKMLPDASFAPDLAEEVPTMENGGISKDGLEWTIKLRKDVKWHDGEPFTAKDVKFTYDTVMNPDARVRGTTGHDKVETFEVVDDYTCKVKLKEPFAPYILVWHNNSIIPEHILANVPDINTAEFNSTKPIGTGPFMLTERVAGDHITFKRYDGYHHEGPYLDSVIYKYTPDQTVAFNQYAAGEMDISLNDIAPERYEESKKLPGIRTELFILPQVEFIYFNLSKPQFKEKEVRQAIYVALDKDTFIKDVWYDTCPRTLSYLFPDHWAYNTDLKDPGYDPEKAMAMLDAAGWKPGADGVREKNGVKLAFTMSTTAGNKPREQAQQLFQQNLLDVGVKMEIKNMPGSVVWGEYTTKSQFDTLMVAWGCPLHPDPDYADRIHSQKIPVKTGVGSNYVMYENPEADKLSDEGVKELDQAKRKEIYWKIQQILFDDLPFAPLRAWKIVTPINDKLQNVVQNPYTEDPISWNPNQWWLKQ